MKKLTRRNFIKSTVASTASVGIVSSLPATVFGNIRGANEDVRVAIIGTRGKGKSHIRDFKKLDGVRVAAICDVDTEIIDREYKKFEANEKPETYVDMRKLFENKNIDAVCTATPNHWHALVTIWACQAGKDVYVEKPIHHNASEGAAMMAAAKKYGRIVQSGLQGRSDPALAESAEYIKAGNLGKVLYAHCLCYNLRNSIGKVGVQPVPDNIDYNLWTGPAPLKPLRRKGVHYNWHWFWDTGNSDLVNQSIHDMDICRWMIGEEKLCKSTMSIGGRFGYDDDAETPNTQVAILEYEKAPIIFEMHGLPAKKGVKFLDNYKGIRTGGVIQCENGYWAGSRGGGWSYDNNGKKLKQFVGDGGDGHQANFIECVRSRKESDLNANLQVGDVSSTTCHLPNISHRLGSIKSIKEIDEIAQFNPQVAEAWEKMKKHLAANEVDVNAIPIAVGPKLTMDDKREKFVGEHFPAFWANRMLTREYREPFVVPAPDKV